MDRSLAEQLLQLRQIQINAALDLSLGVFGVVQPFMARQSAAGFDAARSVLDVLASLSAVDSMSEAQRWQDELALPLAEVLAQRARDGLVDTFEMRLAVAAQCRESGLALDRELARAIERRAGLRGWEDEVAGEVDLGDAKLVAAPLPASGPHADAGPEAVLRGRGRAAGVAKRKAA